MKFAILKNIRAGFLSEGTFALNVMTLLSGTALAQAMPILASPVLTRLYTPADFGVLALYLSLCSFVITVATGCYEYAVVLPESDEDAVNVSFLSITIAFCLSVIAMMAVMLFGNSISAAFKNTDILPWLYFIPLSIFVSGLYNTLNFWGNRKKLFGTLSYSRIAQATTSSGTQLALGAIKLGGAGLIIGNITGQLISGAFLSWRILKTKAFRIRHVKMEKIFHNAKKYQNFPKFDALHYLSDGLRGNGIIFFISGFLNVSILGLYAFAMKAIQVPLNLISSSIMQVFYQRVADAYNKRENIWNLQKRLLIKLLLIVVPALLFIMLFAPMVFSFVFGEKWHEAGLYAVYLMPWLSVNFLAAPFSVIPLVLGRQKHFMFIGFGYNILLPLVVFSVLSLGLGVKPMLISLSLSGFIYQIFVMLWFRRISIAAEVALPLSSRQREIQKEYYNNPDFWDKSNIMEMDEERVRLVESVLPLDAVSLLDIGSGSGLLLNRLRDSSRSFKKLTAIDLSIEALKHVKTDKINASVENLPFKDDQYDCVTALETIEHLPPEIYDKSIAEICRVSRKYVLLTVPNNEDLRKNSIICRKCARSFNPEYHFRSFRPSSMKDLLKNNGFSLVKRTLEGKRYSYIMIEELRDFMRRGRIGYPFSIPCPYCGQYTEKADPGIWLDTGKAKRKNLLKKIWPQRMKFRWLVCLYEKKL